MSESVKWLLTQGFEVSYAPVTTQGVVDVNALAELIRPDTILISIMAVNNEMGAIQPIRAISNLLANQPTITFHVDAVQAIGKIPLCDYMTNRVDLASFQGTNFIVFVVLASFIKKQASDSILSCQAAAKSRSYVQPLKMLQELLAWPKH